MSGSYWYFGGYADYYPKETFDFFEKMIKEKNLNQKGYFIYATTGTYDGIKHQMDTQMEEMLKRNHFFTKKFGGFGKKRHLCARYAAKKANYPLFIYPLFTKNIIAYRLKHYS